MDIGLWVLYAAPPKGLRPQKLTTYATYTKIPSVHSHAVGPTHTHIVMCCEGLCSKYTICNTLLKICLQPCASRETQALIEIAHP